MAKVVDSRFVAGPKNSLAAVDVYNVQSSEVVNTTSEKSNEVTSSVGGDIKVPRADPIQGPDLRKIQEEGKGGEKDETSVLAEAFPNVDGKRLKDQLSKSPRQMQALLDQAVNNPEKEESLKKLQKELLTAGGLIDPNSHSKDITEDILNGIWGPDGNRPSPDCAGLASLFGGGNSDIGADLLLNLMLLAKMIECGFVDFINEFMDTVDNPYIKEGLAILGVGAFFKANSGKLLSDNLDTNRLRLETGYNPFEDDPSGPKSHTSRRMRGTGNKVPGSIVVYDKPYYRNDLDKTPLTSAELAAFKANDEEGYNELFDAGLIPEVGDGHVYTGLRSSLKGVIRDSSTEDGVSLQGLDSLTNYIEAYKIKDAYPDIGYDILKYYRLPRKGYVDIGSEYTKLTGLVEKFDPTWTVSQRDGVEISALKYFRSSSMDSLHVLTSYSASEYIAESLIAKTYYRNKVNRLLQSQYPHLKI